MGATTFVDWFCIPAFFVLFRESLEASVLVAVILQYLERHGEKEIKKQVWLGAWLGGGAALLVGTICLTIYYTSKSALQTAPALIFEGLMLSFACVAVTYFIVTHLAPGMKSKEEWETKWEKKMQQMVADELSGQNKRGFFLLTFTSVFREGIEAVVFIMGMGAAFHPRSLPIASVAGTIVGVAFGVAMFSGLVRLDMSMFFKVSAAFLILIAAGLAPHASYEFQKAGMFGVWACPYRCPDVTPEGNATESRRLREYPYDFALPRGGDWWEAGKTDYSEEARALLEGLGEEDDDALDCDPDEEVVWHEYRIRGRRALAMRGDNRRLTERMASCNNAPNREVGWANREVYDITGCCDTSNLGFYLLMTLFWYRPAATRLEVIVYVFYWLLTIGYAIPKITKIKAFNATLAEAVAEKAGSESAIGVIKVLPAEAPSSDAVVEAVPVDASNEALPIVVATE